MARLKDLKKHLWQRYLLFVIYLSESQETLDGRITEKYKKVIAKIFLNAYGFTSDKNIYYIHKS